MTLKLTFFESLVVLCAFLVVACGDSKKSGSVVSPPLNQDFPDILLSQYTEWSPVLDGDIAFTSSGHSGQKVRVYFNDKASPHFNEEKSLPFSPGSYIAKAVVPDFNTPGSEATRVYFMLKKEFGFDSDNADWSYAVANSGSGSLKFDSAKGSLSLCYSCHRGEASWDYVRTVDYYRKQEVE